MPKYPKRISITLQERLKHFLGSQVAITAEGLALEPGLLTKVFKSTFILVTGERFIPRSLNSLHIINVPKAAKFSRVGVRTTFDANGLFDDIQLIKIGKDFIELQRQDGESGRYVIPLNKVIGLFSISP